MYEATIEKNGIVILVFFIIILCVIMEGKCYNWERYGNCRFGGKCRYLHSGDELEVTECVLEDGGVGVPLSEVEAFA